MTRYTENIRELAADRQSSLAALTKVSRTHSSGSGDCDTPRFRRVRSGVRRSTYDEAEERRARLSMGAFLTVC